MAAPAVVIVSYDIDWPRQFTVVARELRKHLGNVALRIDHIGSTSVPGLAAKDRIDVQITVRNVDEFDDVREKLEHAGYSISEENTRDHVPPWGPFEETEWEKRYFRPPVDMRPTNLHVRVDGRANQIYALLFRDYLRVHPLVAQGYAAAKIRIAEYHGDDRAIYSEIKDPICDLIAVAANAWAKQTDWRPGPSDG
jgi:GrpB-like predicted nucleotidyltransferase (UPF0157 family)